jgi:hypothetical protein
MTRTVAVSTAMVVSADYDSGTQQLVIQTEPVDHGGFVGETLSLRIAIDDPLATFDANCATLDANYASFEFGHEQASSVGAP